MRNIILKSEYRILNDRLNGEEKNELLITQARQLMVLQEHDLVAKKLIGVYLPIASVSMRNYVLGKLSLAYYLGSDYEQALRNAKSLYFYNKGNKKILKDACLMQALALNNMERWDESLSVLTKNKELWESNSVILGCLYDTYNLQPKMKNPETARILAQIIPGSGQIYAGAVGEGIMNFGIQASILALSAYGIYEKYYLTSYFAGLGLFQRFYFGGATRAAFLVEKRNERVTHEYNKLLKDYLIKL